MRSFPIFLFLALLCSNHASAAELFVSPTGSDEASGAKSSPVATLTRAKSLARQFAGKETVTVHVADGIYYLPDTLVFDPEDSGTAEHPIAYAAQNEGGAVLSGGSKLDLTWKPYRNGIFMARTPSGLVVDQLFVDGQNQRMARYPNYDASKKTEAYQGYASDAFSKQRAARWANPTGGYIHAMHRSRWGGYHYRITGTESNGEVTFEGGWQNNRQMGMHPDFRMVENIFEELDAPGEWFHDSSTNTLFYMPQPDTDLSTANVEVVRLSHLIQIDGSVNTPVKHVTLQGFVIRHAARTFMDCKEPLLRSDWAIYRGGAIMLTGTEDVQILDTEFDQVGGNAIFVNHYNRRVLIKGCHIHDAGASGVCFVGDPNAVRDPLFQYAQKNDLATIDRTPGPKTENYPSQCTVKDCLIHGIGRVERQPAGVLIEMASKISVCDCSVYDCARSGINIGDGCWGGHLIERCDVFDTVLETHDHGSFNSWGRDRYWRRDHLEASQKAVDADPGLPFLDAMHTTVIRDSRWRCDHGWDIDLDDGSSNYDIYNNLLLHGGLKFREGFRRRAWNNIAVNNGFHPHVWFNNSLDEVFSNIFMAAHRGARMPSEIAKGKRIDGNLYFGISAEQKDRYANLGWDVNSIIADPMFINPSAGDFRVQEGSPALAIGFKNFPMDQFGVKKPSLKSIAATPVIPALNEELEQDPLKANALNIASHDRYWLGAKLHSLQGDEFSAYGISKESGGVALTEVPSTSEAAKAGLKSGDLVQVINGHPVSDMRRFFQTLSTVGSAPLELNVVRNQQPMDLALEEHSYVVIESASDADEFKSLRLPTIPCGKVAANQSTNNDSLSSLLNGELANRYGPVFGNGVRNGAYRVDLGKSKPIAAITSWSFAKGARGAQKVTLYGSNSVSDPGWDPADYTPLGNVDTTVTNDSNRATKPEYTAASLRAAAGRSLGQFRWILWSVSPVTSVAGGENTAFQELSVEISSSATPLGQKPGPIQDNAFPGKKNDFKGFDHYQFSSDGVPIEVVCPKKPAPGNPWIWRGMFWGAHFNPATELTIFADLKMLDAGYYIVKAPGDSLGHPSGSDLMDVAYNLLTDTYGFSKKPAMVAVSRECLSVYRWASANPEKVSCIYADNGVCALKSWPGGKLVPSSDSKAMGSAQQWRSAKKKYGFHSDEEALAYKQNPIDLLGPLAQAGIPLLHVCGSADDVVPYEENHAIMKRRYEQLGGSIEVIVENGKGHHPHGLKDPAPIIDFFLQHASKS
ncbi:signaling protein [Novipirellula herctigrandis]